MKPTRVSTAARLLCVLLVGSLLLACANRVDSTGPDPLVLGEKADAVFATVSCDSKAADGTCNKMSCKEDLISNCQTFVDGCLKNGHHFSGTAKEGTCSRVL